MKTSAALISPDSGRAAGRQPGRGSVALPPRPFLPPAAPGIAAFERIGLVAPASCFRPVLAACGRRLSRAPHNGQASLMPSP